MNYHRAYFLCNEIQSLKGHLRTLQNKRYKQANKHTLYIMYVVHTYLHVFIRVRINYYNVVVSSEINNLNYCMLNHLQYQDLCASLAAIVGVQTKDSSILLSSVEQLIKVRQ